MLIGELVERRGLKSPDLVFWDAPEGRFTYGELSAASERVARALAAEGLTPGHHAAICAETGFDYVTAHFGAARAGLVLAHLNPRFTPSELAALGAHCDARLLFFGAPQTAAVAEARPALKATRRFVRLPGPAGEAGAQPPPNWAMGWEEWLGQGEGRAFSPPDGLSPESPFQLLYTSGTTGAPKGALISHRAKIRQGLTHCLNLGLVEGDRVLGALPLYHQFAQWLMLAAVPLAGATVVYPAVFPVVSPAVSPSVSRRKAGSGFDPVSVLRALEREGITHLPAVPTMLYRLLDAPEPRAAECGAKGSFQAPALRCIVYGGAPIAPERIPRLRERFPGVRLFQGFGQTETGYCLGLMDADHDARPESIGRPDLFSRLRLVGIAGKDTAGKDTAGKDTAGEDVPDGAVGEIVVSTPYLMNGYYKAPAENAAFFAFGRQWGRTGDLAVRDGEGYYTLVGRKTEMVISGGVKIHPQEVEAVLRRHPGVAEAAVFGLPDPEWGESLAAAVIPADPCSPPTPERLAAHCRKVLAGYKIPRRFILMDDFPRTPSGKVQKHRIRSQAMEGEPDGTGPGQVQEP